MSGRVRDKVRGGVSWVAVVLRAYAFPASVMPALIGAAAAWYAGAPVHLWHLVLTCVGVMALHAMGNLVNDAFDFVKGIDREVLPVSGAVVRGILTARQALGGAAVCLLIGAGIGLYFVFLRGPLVLALGVLGVVCGVWYTAPPLALKYRGLGDLVILVSFGLGVVTGSWLVQTGSLSLTPLVWGLPQAMLVVAILHANNWRDVQRDGALRARTLAQRLGERGSLAYYTSLTAGAVGLAGLLPLLSRWWALTPAMPLTGLVVLLAMPEAIRLVRVAQRRPPGNPPPFVVLDAATARLTLWCGLLATAGLVAGRVLGI